jgi:hypothetical protein|tara:strand:+ start:956 stop:1240 length:285 start_codon:yes stop_codon:yes gene_type:complete
MKDHHWNIIMFGTSSFMFMGFLLSLLGVYTDKDNLAYIGIVIMSSVCFTWWIWVMLVIKDMILRTTKAQDGLGMVREELGLIKKMIRALTSRGK